MCRSSLPRDARYHGDDGNGNAIVTLADGRHGVVWAVTGEFREQPPLLAVPEEFRLTPPPVRLAKQVATGRQRDLF